MKTKETATIHKLECKYCHYSWYPKTPDGPRLCPQCRNPWNQEPIYKVRDGK